MNYLLIDETDEKDQFECEGHVLKTFFQSSKKFARAAGFESIRQNHNIEQRLARKRNKYFNIVHFSAHGYYIGGTKSQLDYSAIVQRRRGKDDVEIFRPHSIVKTGLMADVFLSTNCETFNPLFIDVMRNYKGISNFIAPVGSPYIGDTLIFSLMFYNSLLRKIRVNSVRITDESIIDSFRHAKSSYCKYKPNEDFRLFNASCGQVFK